MWHYMLLQKHHLVQKQRTSAPDRNLRISGFRSGFPGIPLRFPKRKKAYVFSDPYYEVHQAVVVAKDSAIKKPEDLKGKKVGVQIGTTAIEALRKMNVDIDLRTYDEVGLVFEDMRNGRLDVVVCDDPVARYYASRKEGYKDLMKVAFLTEDVEYIGFVFSKDNAELAAQVNKGLKAIRENGKEKAIRNKWLGE